MSAGSGSSVSRKSGPTKRTDSSKRTACRVEGTRRVGDGQAVAKHEQVEEPSHLDVIGPANPPGGAPKAQVANCSGPCRARELSGGGVLPKQARVDG